MSGEENYKLFWKNFFTKSILLFQSKVTEFSEIERDRNKNQFMYYSLRTAIARESISTTNSSRFF